jgi:hypothetical protein
MLMSLIQQQNTSSKQTELDAKNAELRAQVVRMEQTLKKEHFSKQLLEDQLKTQ